MLLSNKNRVTQLAQDIERHRDLYYAGQPEISDEQYDALEAELKMLEGKNISANSPTQKVGAPPSNTLKPITHPAKLYSLDNVYNQQELNNWFKSLPASTGYVVEPKIDGLSIAVTYVNGRYEWAATRGDGMTGEDVSCNAGYINGIPDSFFNQRDSITVRGEVYLSAKAFEKINGALVREGKKPYANARNAASGMLRQLGDFGLASNLSVLFHGCLEGIELDYAELRGKLDGLGLPVPHAYYASNLNEVWEAINKIDEEKASYGFDTDGAVVKIDSHKLQQQLGYTAKYPKWAVAYKYKAIAVRSKVLSIEVGVGRTGAVTPCAIISPVKIGGVTVASVTLHNMDEITRKDIRIGDTVLVHRAGEVIPEIIAVDKDARTGEEAEFVMPSTCPECKAPLNFSTGVAVICDNPFCKARVIASLLHFGAKAALNIKGLGEKAVEELYNTGLVRDVGELVLLTKEKLAVIPRLRGVSGDNLLAALAEVKTKPTYKILFALGIKSVGETAAKKLIDHFGSISKLSEAPSERVVQESGAGPQTSKQVYAYFNGAAAVEVLAKFKLAGFDL